MSSFQESQELQRQALSVKVAVVLEDQEMQRSQVPFASCLPAATTAKVAPSLGHRCVGLALHRFLQVP